MTRYEEHPASASSARGGALPRLKVEIQKVHALSLCLQWHKRMNRQTSWNYSESNLFFTRAETFKRIISTTHSRLRVASLPVQKSLHLTRHAITKYRQALSRRFINVVLTHDSAAVRTPHILNSLIDDLFRQLLITDGTPAPRTCLCPLVAGVCAQIVR